MLNTLAPASRVLLTFLVSRSHHSWPSWTRPPPLTYEVLRKALDLYGGAEMRFGR